MIDPFSYQPPNPATSPKYAAIRDDEATCVKRIEHAIGEGKWQGDNYAHYDKQAAFAQVNAACKFFADEIARHAPSSADTTVAIRCVRLARMRANRQINDGRPRNWREPIEDAGLWAAAAVALNTPTPEAS